MAALSALFFQKQSHFGLAIGRTAIRAVEVDRGGKIKSAVEVMLPEGTFNANATVDAEKILAGLKKLLGAGKFSTRYVSVCFSETYAYSRQYSVPIIPLEEVREAISYHIKDLFPFEEGDIYFDWKLLSKSETELQVSVVAVQKRLLDPLITAITTLGLKPLSFQSTASVISQLLKLKPDESAVIAEINKPGAYVTLVSGPKVLFTTVINSAANETPESYFKNIDETTREIVQYYFSKKSISSTKLPIIFTGSLANENLIQQITKLMSNPVKILRTPVQNPAFNKSYAVAIAPVAPPSDETTVNLLPASVQTVYDAEITKSFYTSLLTRVCFFLILICVSSVGSFMALSVVKNQIDGQIKTLSSTINAQKTDTQKLLTLNASAKSIVALAPMRTTPKDKLIVLTQLIPQKVIVNQWDYDDGKQLFIVKGTAEDRADLLAFKEKLEESGEFAQINLPLGSLESPKNVKFTITFVIAN